MLCSTPALSREEVPSQLPYHHLVKPYYQDVVTVMTSNEARNAMIGDLLHLLLAPRIVHENPSPVWKLFYDRDCMHSVETQSLGTQLFRNHQTSSKSKSMKSSAAAGSNAELGGHGVISDRSQLSKVVVYHHGEEILVELQVNLTKESVALLDAKSVHVLQRVGLLPRPQGKSKAGKTREIDNGEGNNAQNPGVSDNSEVIACMKSDQCYRFFSRMFTDDVLLLIQPNFTEIFEGNIQKPLSQLILESDLGYVIEDAAITTELTYEQNHEKNHQPKNNSQTVSKETGYYHCMSNWTCVDSIGGKLSTSTIRARYLILSKLGSISGYYVRLEIFEERFGEIRILLFGLSENDYDGGGDGKKGNNRGNSTALLTNSTDIALAALQQKQETKSEKVIFQIKVDKAYMYQVLNFCDEYVERDKLESSDTFAMAYIFSDRLSIQPSYSWFHFLSHHDFLPIQIRKQDHNNVDSSSMFDLRFRQKGGPGRLVGRRLLNIHQMFFKPETKQTYQPTVPREEEEEEEGDKDIAHEDDEKMTEEDIEDMDEEDIRNYFNHTSNKLLVLLSIYEINNETSAHELRLVMYHFYDCQMVEYRVSAMERVMLFRDDEALVDQLLRRMRLVYCDVGKSQLESFQRVVLPMTELGSDKSVLSSLVLHEYEVEGDEEYEVQSVDSDGQYDDEDDSMIDGDSLADSSTSTAKKRKVKAFLAKKKKLGKHSKIEEDSVEEEAKERIVTSSGWAWALYFDRSALSEVRSNLVISIVFSIQKKGFFFTIRDPRSLHEASKFISFPDSIPYFQSKTLEILEDEISNLDESVAFDIMDDLFSAVDIVDLDQGGTGVVLQLDLAAAQANMINASDDPTAALDMILKPSQALTDLVLAKVREIPEDKLYHPMSRKQGGSASYRISLEIFRAKDLARIGIVGMRNAYAVLKYNQREIGRTPIVKGTLHPDWSKTGNFSFDVHINKENLLMTCALDVEVYDTDAKGNTSDFLGVVRLQGNQLKTMMTRDSYANPDEMIENDKYREFLTLETSRKLGDADNKHVQGKIELRATLKVMGDNQHNPLLKQSSANQDAFLKAQDEIDERARRQMSDFSPSTPTALMLIPSAFAGHQKLSKLSTLSTEQVLSCFKYFDLYVKEIDLTGLNMESLQMKQYQVMSIPKDAEIVISIAMNQIEIYRCLQPYHSHSPTSNTLCCYRGTPEYPDDHTSEVEAKKMVIKFEDAGPIECRVPLTLPLGLCQLRVEVQLHLPSMKTDPNQPLKSNLLTLGVLELQGGSLKDLIKRSFIAEYQQHQMQSVMHYRLLAYQSINGRNPQKPLPYKLTGYSNLSLMASVGLQCPCKYYKVSIRSARNLAKADTFGKR